MKRTWVSILAVMTGMALLQRSSLATPWTVQNSAWNVNVNPNSNPADYYGSWSGHVYQPSPDDWRKIPVYQFITDRWNDGDPSNNELAYPGYDLRSVGARHGGDFLGLRDKLDYIRALGYKAIWISPVFQNRTNSYHGYGQIDFTLLDERFGTLDDFRALVNKAHELGLYVIVDIVVNHLENLYYFDGHPNDGAPFRLHSGEYALFPRNPAETYVDFPVNNTFSTSGQYCDVFGDDGYRRVDSGSGSFWESDLHHNGDLNDYSDPWQNHLGKIYGALDDIRTTHPRVQDKIIAMTKALISSCDIDGIRMDTPMQVPRYFFQRWCPAVKAHAASLGKNDFFIFGEFYCSRERAATMVGRGKSPTMYGNGFAFIDGDYTMDGGINYRAYFDFFQSAVKDQVNGNLTKLKTGLDADLNSYDFYDPVWGQVRYTHLNFYNNHDQWRLVHNPAGATDGFKKTDLASAIISFWPGIPLFYYGDEQGFCTYGTALDGWAREDFMTSVAWDNVGALVTPNPAQKDNFDMTNPHFLWVQKCMNVREKYPVLQTADTVYERWNQGGNGQNGIYVYSRAQGDTANWALVAFNTWRDPLQAGGGLGNLFTGWNEGDVIVNALDPSETYTLSASGKLSSLPVNAYETKVFVLQGNRKPISPVVTNSIPAHDQRAVSGTVAVRLQFSEVMDETSLKAAFRYDGQPLDSSALTWSAAARELTSTVTATPGIHTIEVLTNAVSAAGLNLFGKFRSRFLFGDDANILVNRTATNDVNLINQGAATTTTTSVTLYHQATGAQKMRVRVDGGQWSSWQAYAANSACNLTPGNGSKSVEVQYWADGSAAYFVSDTIQLSLSGLAAVDNFTGYSSSLYNQSGGSGWSGNWGDGGFSSSPNVIPSALGTVNTVASAAPFVEYPLNNSMGGINVLEATRTLASTVASGTVYIYGLMAVGGTGAGGFSTASSYGGIGLYNGTTEKFLIGESYQAANWGAAASGNLNGAAANSSTAISTFITTLVCAKIDFAARTLTLWVNPDFGKTESCSASAAAFGFGDNDASFNVVRLRAGNANNGDKWQFDNVNVTTTPPFATASPTTLGNNGPICSGATLNLTATTVAGATYAWTGPNGFTSAAQNPSIANVTTAAAGTYHCLVTANGCPYPDATTSVAVNPTPATSAINGLTLVQSGQAGVHYSFSLTSGSSYAWTVPSGASITAGGSGPNNNEIGVTFGTTAGNVTVTETSAAGCGGAQVSLSVDVNHPPIASPASYNCTPGLSVGIQITGPSGLASDPDGDALTVTASTPSKGSATVVSAAGTKYIYYLNMGSTGADSFDYTVTDGRGGITTATISITVAAPGGQSQNTLSPPVDIGGGQKRIKFLGLPGKNYQLESKARLEDPNWTPIGSAMTADSTGLVQFDFTPSGDGGYYRTRWVP